LVQALKGDNEDLAAIGSMFRETKAVARLNFSTVLEIVIKLPIPLQVANHGVNLEQNEYIF
jgi:hypothetical protein